MGRPRILDLKIMSKLAKKLGKPTTTAVNKMVSARASRHGISSEAALVLLAREHGIGTSTYQRKLDPTKQAEIRDALPVFFISAGRTGRKGNSVSSVKSGRKGKPSASRKENLKSAIEFLIQDEELLGRCADLLLARKHFDRPINQATLVLEDRIRKKAQLTNKLVGENLVNNAFNEELKKTVLQVSSADPDDQRGFTQILRGMVPTFRHKTHHHVTTNFSRYDAMRVCCFIDVLLRVVDNSQKVR